MGLKVIGAGLGRNATFSLKFALEHIGFGPCHHMSEVFADARRQIPLWIAAGQRKPDWDAIFDGFQSCTDYPACSWWKELADHYPEAKMVLTLRDPDSWFDSVSETIFSDRMLAQSRGTPLEAMMQANVIGVFGDRIADRAFMTDWYSRRNQEVIDTMPTERLLVFHPKEGWEPLCAFLGVEVPGLPFPRVNSRDELGAASDEQGGIPADMAEAEKFAKAYIDHLKAKAFSG